MDGKIIQEAEGIVNSSGFVKMSDLITTTNGSQTIQTDFTPKIIMFNSQTSISGFGLRGCKSVIDPKDSESILKSIVWGARSITFTCDYRNITVVVLG